MARGGRGGGSVGNPFFFVVVEVSRRLDAFLQCIGDQNNGRGGWVPFLGTFFFSSSGSLARVTHPPVPCVLFNILDVNTKRDG